MDIECATATELVLMLATGDIASRELLDVQIAQMERHNPAINAVVALDLERACSQARAADEDRVHGGSRRPLHGLPMTVKDAFETEGLVTTSGATELRHHVPERDADAVRRLRDAGAVIFGKTNLPIYASDSQTYNEVYGLTRNPWDLARSPGGSSGGSAAALAAGITALELGSDIAGSIRGPAHCCGVYGHKPTWGVISARGHIPGAPGTLASDDLGVIGPMGRSVADLQLGLDVLAGDVLGVPGARLPAARTDLGALTDIRIGVWLDDPYVPTDNPVLHVLEHAIETLAAGGATIIDDARLSTPLEVQHLLYLGLLTGVIGQGLPDEARDAYARTPATGPNTATSPEQAMQRGAIQTHAAWIDADEARHRIQVEWTRLFEQVDVLITPVLPVAAIPHDIDRPAEARTIRVNGQPQPYLSQLVWAGLASLPLLPATAIPAGQTTDGLPVGLQIIGARYSDHTNLRVAALADEALGGNPSSLPSGLRR